MKKKALLCIISTLLLCLVLASAMLLSGTAENFDLTVYLSPEGNGGNSGLTEEAPVSTLAEALAVANAEVGSGSARVRFILLGDLEVSDDPYGSTPFDFQLTVSGKTGSETFIATGTYVTHMGDTRYENMRFTQASSTNYSFLCGGGYDLVLGTGLSCTPSSKGYYLNLAGGVHGNKKKDFNSDSSLTVLSGQWETLYAGSYKENQKGNATLYAENCRIHTNVGTCFTEDHVGKSSITLKNCEVAIKSSGMLQGGPTNAAGTLSDTLTLTVEDCNVRDFGVGYKRTITAPLSLSIKDSTFTAAYSVTATGDSEIHLSASEGKTLDLTPAKDITATTFTGGGTLILGSESTLTAKSVSGSTVLSTSGSPAPRVYLRAPAATPDNAFTYSGTPSIKISVVGDEKIWSFCKTVTLKTPEDTALILYTKFKDGVTVSPASTYSENGYTYYNFENLSEGNYQYNVKGTGYYQITKNLYLSAEKLENDLLIDCTPPLLAGTGYEPSPSANSNVKDYTNEAKENFLISDPENWPEYKFIFTTPYFTRDSYEKGFHQATTQEEMMAYLRKKTAESKNLYLFSLGKSPSYGFDIPIVVFTSSDLSGAKTLAEAAEICRANGKLTFQYQAQVHGNEPAGGEGALAMIGALGSEWGNQYADDLNICIIPRINTDGSYAYTRSQVTHNRNLNRDYLLLEAEEIPMILQAYNLFKPEIVLDGHEMNVSTGTTSGTFNDVTLGSGGNESADPLFEETGVEMMLSAFANMKANGLNYHFYSSSSDSTDPTTARAYYQMRGSVSLLLETSGIHAGQNNFHRRVLSQFVCVEAYLDYAKEHKSELRGAVATARKNLADQGSTYSADHLFALKTTAVTHEQTYPKTLYNFATGLATGSKNVTAKKYSEVNASRPLPTAYVIPKNSYSDEILRIAKAHQIFYYEMAPDTASFLMGYNGSYDSATKAVTDVTLSAETLVSFPTGAYVFPMNQDGALILAAMFEPDNLDIYSTSDKSFTLAQSGMIPCENGSFLMYRSQRDLQEGKIESIAAPEAPTGLSVIKKNEEDYVGSITGLDPTFSYEIRHETESTFAPVPAGSTVVENVPFGFVEIRFVAQATVPASKLVTLEILPPKSALPTVHLAPVNGSDREIGTESAPVQSLERAISLLNVLRRYVDGKATVVFDETLSVTENLTFPAHDYPLYITSKSGAEGISSSKNITFGGETEVERFTFTYTGTTFAYIVANGNKLTLGESINSNGKNNLYFALVGGDFDQPVESTDLAVLSGVWRNVYAGGYKGSVAGDISLVMKNATVIAQIQNSYSGKTDGSMTYDLENVSVESTIFCGNASKQDVKGNIVLNAKNCTIPALYAGSRDAGNVDGVVTVTLENCTACDLYGTSKNQSSVVAASYLTLIDTAPGGVVEGWTNLIQTKKGDLDGSKTVDMDDAIYLLFHTFYADDYPLNQPCDFDHDGDTDMDDAIYLLFHTFYEDDYPLK